MHIYFTNTIIKCFIGRPPLVDTVPTTDTPYQPYGPASPRIPCCVPAIPSPDTTSSGRTGPG